MDIHVSVSVDMKGMETKVESQNLKDDLSAHWWRKGSLSLKILDLVRVFEFPMLAFHPGCLAIERC